MFHRILVPLDGSTRAEQVLPIAIHIAKATGGSVILLQVTSLEFEYGPYFTQAGYVRETIMKAKLAHARNYLKKLQTLVDVGAQIDVIPGIPVSTILAYIQSHQIDLVVLCSHGYTGIKRWALGSVASGIARHSSVPVLIARENSSLSKHLLPKKPAPIRALVALDGSSISEAVLTPTAHLVSALAAPAQGVLHLTQVVKLPTFEEELDYKALGIDIDVRKEAIAAAGQYLQTMTDKLIHELAPKLGLNITWSVEECKDIAETLVTIAEHGNLTGTTQACHLIALATHGRHGIQRVMLGSVADHVLNGAHLPLLIVRPSEA